MLGHVLVNPPDDPISSITEEEARHILQKQLPKTNSFAKSSLAFNTNLTSKLVVDTQLSKPDVGSQHTFPFLLLPWLKKLSIS